jgi:hypothetical protein
MAGMLFPLFEFCSLNDFSKTGNCQKELLGATLMVNQSKLITGAVIGAAFSCVNAFDRQNGEAWPGKIQIPKKAA